MTAATPVPAPTPGTFTLRVSHTTGQISMSLQHGEHTLSACITAADARAVGADFFTAAARADLITEEQS